MVPTLTPRFTKSEFIRLMIKEECDWEIAFQQMLKQRYKLKFFICQILPLNFYFSTNAEIIENDEN